MSFRILHSVSITTYPLEQSRPRASSRPHSPPDTVRRMTHLTDLISAQKGPFHTLEFFPPRTEAGFVNLLDRINRLASGSLPAPLAVSVTWGAGGSTADRTMELAEQVIKLGLDVILHLTCTNMPKEKVDQALKVSWIHRAL